MTTRRAPATDSSWAFRGLRPWTVWVWLPLCYTLLITPADDAAKRGTAAAWGAAGLAALLFTAAVLTRFSPGRRHRPLPLLLLAALAALATSTTVIYSPDWTSLFVLLAIGVGVVVGAREAPYVILLTTAAATVTAMSAGASSDKTFTTGLTVLMSGLGTYAFHHLFEVVAELRCTREELALLAVSEERERFARDLHDLLGHTLSVIVVKAEAVRRLVPRDSAAAAVHAADIETIGREALADVRRAAVGYRGAGLERELDRARSALDAAGVSLTVVQDQETDNLMPDSTNVLLGWVVREAVTNVVRHAQASQCTITVDQTGGSVRLGVADDGQSIEEDSMTGAGLRGLEERVTAAGGRFDAGRTGQGFRLVVDVPSLAGATPR